MSITGGTFSSKNADAVKAYTFSNTGNIEGEWENAKESVSISGGTFSSDVTPISMMAANGIIILTVLSPLMAP